MQTITVERTIPAPIDDVFAWIADTSHWERSPWVIRNRLATPGQQTAYGVGAVRSHLWWVGWFHEVVTGYDAPHTVTYVVDRCIPPARHGGGRTDFSEVPGGTHVVWTTKVELPVPVLAGPLTRGLVGPTLNVVFGSILRTCEKELTRIRVGQ